MGSGTLIFVDHPFFDHRDGAGTRLPIAMAHRGFSTDGLENSMAAFRAAVDLGYRYLETDVHTSADGVVFVFHDPTLERVAGVAGRIAGMSAADVAAALIGGREPVPTFDELVTGLPEARLNVDVKDWNSVPSLAAAIERHQLHHRVLVTSFSDRRRRAVLRLLSRPVASSAGVVPVGLFTVLGWLLPGPLFRRFMPLVLRDVQAFQVPVRYGVVKVATAGFVRRAHSLGLLVHVWTVNDPAEMHRLLELGADGIVTDRADFLREVLRDRGQWPS